MNNTERLIGKMNDELAAFVAGLERLPVQDVIEKAGEIAVKTDMALLVEEAFLGPKETKALLGMRMPLEYLYQEYLKKDTGLSNVLIDHMQDAAADEAGRQRKRNRERIAGEARLKKRRIQNMTKQQMKVVAQAEHEMFCLRDLLEGSVPAKVMNRAYEYVIKQDLLSVLRETPLTHQQLSVLTPQRRPLDFLYRLWLKTEYSHIDALRRAVRRETRRIYLKRQAEAFRKEHPMG